MRLSSVTSYVCLTMLTLFRWISRKDLVLGILVMALCMLWILGCNTDEDRDAHVNSHTRNVSYCYRYSHTGFAAYARCHLNADSNPNSDAHLNFASHTYATIRPTPD